MLSMALKELIVDEFSFIDTFMSDLSALSSVAPEDDPEPDEDDLKEGEG